MRFKTALILSLAATVVRAGSPHPVRTLHVDAVELVLGREVVGKVDLSAKHGRYEYLFSTQANRDAFLKTPEKFEIQLGGACARMGPLSGAGSSDLFAVHEGKIYLFASEQCRKRFMSAPNELLESPDPPVEADAAARKRGRELLDLAVKGVGGEAALNKLASYRAEAGSTTKQGDTTYVNKKAWTVRFPSDFRMDDDWNDARWATVAIQGDAFFAADEVWTMHPQQREALEREFRRKPLVILRSRSRDDFVAAAVGAGKVNDRAVEFVAVSFGGATTKLAVDLESGRIHSAAFKGRGPTMALGDVERTYADFQTAEGLEYPTSFTAAFNGKREDKLDRKADRVVINGPLDPTWFQRPQ